MAEVLTELASGENSRIFFDKHYFYRLLPRSQADFFLDLLHKLTPHVKAKVVGAKPLEHDVGIDKNADQAILAHEKIRFISYPHEWCASMLKDAALFQLKLQQELLVDGLFLKDAHPWNILFANGEFKFVDLPSIITQQTIASFNQMMKSMFIPYFIMPLLGYAYGKRHWAKKRLEVTTLNAATDVITMRDCLPARKMSMKRLGDAVKLVKKTSQAKHLLSRQQGDIQGSLHSLQQLVESIDVNLGNSDYKNYYSQKGELNPHVYHDSWNAKQKNVYHAISDENIHTVLDMACNTGWYSIMAHKMGKNVVAVDYDEACIEELYNQVKENGYSILPIWSSFTDLTSDRYSVSSGKRVLINFAERIKCDAVIALGFVHHLALGMGLTFADIVEKLSACTTHKLIVEFVELNDEMIVKHADFFPAFHQNNQQAENYNLEAFIKAAMAHFTKFEVLSSYPVTRKIVVFKR
ncbi:MAG: hypothetical protein AB7I18_10790 [Candidatus Berkiella sp.]